MTAFPEGLHLGNWHRFAAELAEAPTLVVRLIEEHRPSPSGRCASLRCREADLALRWPCAVHAVAAEARRLLDVRATANPPRHLVAVDDLPGGAQRIASAPTVDPLDAEIRAFFAVQVPGA